MKLIIVYVLSTTISQGTEMCVVISVALWGKGEVHRDFWWGSLEKTDNLEVKELYYYNIS